MPSDSITMADTETACDYARNENCFTDHQGASFHPETHLKSLEATAFSPKQDLLADECGRYSYSLTCTDFDLGEGENRDASVLKKLEQRCKAVEERPYLLPRWNDVYGNLLLPTELMDIGFDVDLDVREYQEQARS